jgi:pimeloyl-ACP methyl ester carboxylesterase
MPYDKYRKELLEGYYDYQLEGLMSGYDPAKPTVILLPGGMGSQLERTEHKYPASPNVINDVVWMDLGVLPPKRDARRLEIKASGEDLDKYVVAAHGPFSFLNLTPYGELEGLAQSQGWNYGVFGFDWRRSLEESAGYFKGFVLKFQKRVKDDYGKDPIPELTIVCHSMGGMVCTYALRNTSFSGLGFHAIVTIATPFYGTSTQQERYYVGVPGVLNTIYGAKTVVEIIASLPGPFTLMFLPKVIYNRDGQKLGLSRYPELDPNGNLDADPYNSAMLSRWPDAVRAHKRYLVDARDELNKLSTPINANIAPVFFNVRSSLDTTTAVELLWNNINGDDFIPGTSPSPLTGIAGTGDGTVPAWSAWHAYCRPKNRHELKQAKDHGNLLEHDEVLGVIDTIVKTRKLPTAAKRGAKKPSVASKKKVADVTAEWVERARRKQPPPAELFENSVKRAIFAELIGGPKPKMSRRRQLARAKRKKRA